MPTLEVGAFESLNTMSEVVILSYYFWHCYNPCMLAFHFVVCISMCSSFMDQDLILLCIFQAPTDDESNVCVIFMHNKSRLYHSLE